jgi:hypothetical protein
MEGIAMRLWLASFFLAAIPLCAQASARLEPTGDFCLQTFQLYSPLLDWKPEKRLKWLESDVLGSPCQATFFQSLWQKKDFDELLGALAAGGEAVVFADTYRADAYASGLVSAFNGSLVFAESQLFSANLNGLPRDLLSHLRGEESGFTVTEAQLGDSPAAYFVNFATHPTDSGIRLAQIAQLVDHLLQLPQAASLPLFVSGTLHAGADSLELALLKDLLRLRDSYGEVHTSGAVDCGDCGFSDFLLFRSSPDFALDARSADLNLQGAPNAPLSLKSTLHWTLRQPDFLLESDPQFQQLITKAETTLDRAIATLEKDGRPALAKGLELLKTWRKRFELGLPLEIRDLYRLR